MADRCPICDIAIELADPEYEVKFRKALEATKDFLIAMGVADVNTVEQSIENIKLHYASHLGRGK